VTLSDPAAVCPEFVPGSGMIGTSVTFQLTVTDTAGLQDTDTCTVTISRMNLPPTADAGPDQTTKEGVTVTLDGSGSSDPDDGIASYQWLQTAGPEVTLSNSSAVQPTFIPDVDTNEVFVFQLTVTDNSGSQSSDTCVVNVSWANEPPIADAGPCRCRPVPMPARADAGPDQTVNENTLVTLDGSSSSDPEDTALSYAWTQTGGPEVTLSDIYDEQATFEAPTVKPEGDSLTFELTVTDAGGLRATDTCIVNVSAFNVSPTADAGADQTVGEGVTVTLDGANSSTGSHPISGYRPRDRR